MNANQPTLRRRRSQARISFYCRARQPLLLLLCLLAPTLLPLNLKAAGAAPLFLVRAGEPVATIVLDAEPSEAALFAASELQSHVGRITGARLPVATDASRVRGPRILVGESAATRQLGLRGTDFRAQEYLIRFAPDMLVLMGRDDPRPAGGNVVVHGRPQRVEGRFGGALQFDGAHDALTVPDCAFSDDAGSLEAWVQLAPGERGLDTILRLDGGGPWSYHIVEQLPKSRRVRYVSYDGKTSASVESRELDDDLHQLVATHSVESGRIELFVDGVSQGTAKYSRTACAGAALNVGALVSAKPANQFAGLIDEVRVSTSLRDAIRSYVTGPFQPDADTVVLLPLDESERAPRDHSGSLTGARPPDIFTRQATCYAVYEFLERFCGVRWYSPTEFGMVHPATNTLAVAGREVRRQPAFAYRMPTSGAASSLSGTNRALWGQPSRRDLDLFWHRLRIGGEPYAANHSFYGYYDRFWEKNPKRPELFEAPHPDWFAQGYPKQLPPQMCYTSTGFVAQVIHDARDYFDGRGAKPGAQTRGDFFALVPMDNGSYCKCAACQAEMDQPEWDNKHFSRGAASDYLFGFANKVAKAVKHSHPGKQIATLAYAEYAYHPKHVRLEPNISVQLCLHVRNWWAPAMESNDLAFYRDWVTKEKGRPLYLWLYYCFPEEMGDTQNFRSFPGFFAHTQARQFKMFARDGIRGAFLNGLGEQVDTYVAFKLLDDPGLDVDALLDEFFTRYYGAAAGPMKRLYLKIESIYSTPANYPPAVQKENRHFHQTEEIAWGWLGTEARMKELSQLMEQARAAAVTDLEKYRVSLFDQGVWLPMLEGRRAYEAKKPATRLLPP